jgi:putative membrane protein
MDSRVVDWAPMDPQTTQAPPPRPEGSVRDHLANERTMLAWQRTALALVGLGFVVDRFAFDGMTDSALGTTLGVVLIISGGATALVGAWRFTRTEHEIDHGTFESSIVTYVALAVAIIIGAIAVGIYLLTAG